MRQALPTRNALVMGDDEIPMLMPPSSSSTKRRASLQPHEAMEQELDESPGRQLPVYRIIFISSSTKHILLIPHVVPNKSLLGIASSDCSVSDCFALLRDSRAVSFVA